MRSALASDVHYVPTIVLPVKIESHVQHHARYTSGDPIPRFAASVGPLAVSAPTSHRQGKTMLRCDSISTLSSCKNVNSASFVNQHISEERLAKLLPHIVRGMMMSVLPLKYRISLVLA